MSNDPSNANPVAELLAHASAPNLVGGVRLPRERSLPIEVSYGVGKPGSGKLTGAMFPLAVGVVMLVISAIATISAIRTGSTDIGALMPIGLPLFIAAFITGPALFKMGQGRLQWTRTARIGPEQVEVTDRADRSEATWTEPLSAYRDIHQAFDYIPSPDGSGDGLELETILLRHPDPARTIYVAGVRKTNMGGMSMMDMIQAGREGRREDVEAAVGDTRNPEVEAFVAMLVAETGLPLVQEFD